MGYNIFTREVKILAKYRKKPVVVEAFQFYVDPMPDWFMDKLSSNGVTIHRCDHSKYGIEDAYCEINTLEGIMTGKGGDYIIKGVQGELYPCKPDIFETTYELHKPMNTIVVEAVKKELENEEKKKAK